MADLSELSDPERLRAVRDSGLMDTSAESGFDQLTRMAAQLMGAPSAFITVLDDRRQFLKSAVGTEGTDYAAGNSTSLDMSFCKHVVVSKQPLIVENAHDHELVRHNKAVDAGVVAYAGIPLETSAGEAIGALCVVDSKPRDWSEDDIENLRALARSAMRLIHERTEVQTKSRDAAETSLLHCVVRHFRSIDTYGALIRNRDVPDLTAESQAQYDVQDSFEDLRAAFSKAADQDALPQAVEADLFNKIGAYIAAEERRTEALREFSSGNCNIALLEAAIGNALDSLDRLRVGALHAGADL